MIYNPDQKIDQYIEHRIKRENQIINILKQVLFATFMKYKVFQLGQANALEVTATLYSNLPKSVQIGAFGNIRQTLEKLIQDERVVRAGLIDYKLV